MNRTSLLGAAVACGALLSPTVASAADAPSLVAGPAKVKGYDVSLTATDGGSADTMSVIAVKRSGGSTQTHFWSFSSGISVKITKRGATLKGSLGRFGTLNGTVRAGRLSRGTVPAGCTGKAAKAQRGTLAGRSKLILDSTFFRTVAAKGWKAQITRGGDIKCSGGDAGQPATGLVLSAVTEDGLMVSIAKTGGKVVQQAMVNEPAASTAPAQVMHSITAPTGDAGLSAASDLSTATAKAQGPFLTGSLSFAGEPMGGMASGTLTGDFAAAFDSIGTKTLPADAAGVLMQR